MRAAAAGAALILGTMVSLSGCATSGSAGSSGDASPVGTWGETEIAYLELGEDGALSGTDGCNRLIGSWEADGTAVTFVGVATTMMACEGVDTWLSALDTAEVDRDSMTVFDIAGEQIGVLDRRS